MGTHGPQCAGWLAWTAACLHLSGHLSLKPCSGGLSPKPQAPATTFHLSIRAAVVPYYLFGACQLRGVTGREVTIYAVHILSLLGALSCSPGVQCEHLRAKLPPPPPFLVRNACRMRGCSLRALVFKFRATSVASGHGKSHSCRAHWT